MFCAQCRKPLSEGARFCDNCGAATAPTPPASAPGPPPADSAPGPGTEGVFHAASGAQASAVAQGLIARVKNILLSPKTEWHVIAAEPSSSRAIYMGYVAPLVAIGVIATFIGHSVIGIGAGFLGTYRAPIGAGIATAIVAFLLAFLNVFLVALIVDALAPSFGGQRDALRALKVTVYSYTPAWVAAVLHILPVLGVVAILAALYGLYLLYLGLPLLMRCPQDKSIGYTIVVVLCAIVMWIVLAAAGALMGLAGFGGLG